MTRCILLQMMAVVRNEMQLFAVLSLAHNSPMLCDSGLHNNSTDTKK